MVLIQCQLGWVTLQNNMEAEGVLLLYFNYFWKKSIS